MTRISIPAVTEEETTSVDVYVVPRNPAPTPAPTPEPVPATHSPWQPLPSASFARQWLWLSGVILLVSGVATTIFWYYIFKQVGRTYYIDLGLVAAFVTIILGFLALKTSRWEWPLNHFTITGFLLLGCLNLIQFCVLALMTIQWYPHNKLSQNDSIVSSLVCVLSFLILVMATLGLSITVCWDPSPPENRPAAPAVV